jgi:cytidyltransferase-like protein
MDIVLDATEVRNLVEAFTFAGSVRRPVVGLTNGCFDLLHPGHVAMLEDCARRCDLLVVAVDDDERVAALKGPRCPWRPFADRARVVGGLRAVWRVVPITEAQTLEDIMDELRPAFYFCRADEDVPETTYAMRLRIPIVALERHGDWSTRKETSQWRKDVHSRH